MLYAVFSMPFSFLLTLFAVPAALPVALFNRISRQVRTVVQSHRASVRAIRPDFRSLTFIDRRLSEVSGLSNMGLFHLLWQQLSGLIVDLDLLLLALGQLEGLEGVAKALACDCATPVSKVLRITRKCGFHEQKAD